MDVELGKLSFFSNNNSDIMGRFGIFRDDSFVLQTNILLHICTLKKYLANDYLYCAPLASFSTMELMQIITGQANAWRICNYRLPEVTQWDAGADVSLLTILCSTIYIRLRYSVQQHSTHRNLGQRCVLFRHKLFFVWCFIYASTNRAVIG